ncbi:hypothetical protein CJ307_06205 [Klebsiella quasipneumoniae]|nr:hypothetical protein CJ307_06205 [Klebsiella quasipneumoniae]
MFSETLTIHTRNTGLWWERQHVIARQPPPYSHVAKHQKAVLISFCCCHKFAERFSFRVDRVLDEVIDVFFQQGVLPEGFPTVSGQHPECRPEQIFAVSTGKRAERHRDSFMHRPVLFRTHIVFLFMMRRLHAITAPGMSGICRRTQ